jgi:hypothetical protein
MKPNQAFEELKLKLKACSENLLETQLSVSRLSTIDKPTFMPTSFHQDLISMCKSLQDFCAQQRSFLNYIEDDYKRRSK